MAAARAEVVGLRITGIFFRHDVVEVHMGHVVLTGRTKPFGRIGSHSAGPSSMVSLIGRTVGALTVVDGQYVALDSGDSRLAFPIGGPTATGPESVTLVRPTRGDVGVEWVTWSW
ncbi:hypothetical protein JQN72_16705 [Phycicoccus sp. CSK15P-2]|uniref:hypothetical protein n=1 Tax=Phycicoccus sp. CSK15P-2 TaxID=2807627 RepID=UPI00194FC275|nr:hypothetical protein [Phycicoccus sp. CSK15P-2]MBM6405885.1 hypothetical protein [Phycicoccus sp. CSK15P-2]